MAFTPTEPSNFLSIRLTNVGRRMLSLGKLKFHTAVVSDREIDYRFAIEEDYEHSCNRVLTTNDDAPALPYENFDGTPPISLDGNVYSDKKVITASTSSYGIFSALTEPNSIGTFSGYVYNESFDLGSGNTNTNELVGTDLVLVSSGSPYSSGIVTLRGLKTRFGPGQSFTSSTTANPTMNLWYRFSAVTSQVIQLDRNVPWFDGAAIIKGVDLFFLPWSGTEVYWGTGKTEPSPVWNMNIVRTSTEIGTPQNYLRYTQYGSIEYAGAKRYFGFDMNTRMVGFVHYTNSDTGNTFGEQFIPKSTIVDFPIHIWHRTKQAPGESRYKGIRFTDRNSDIYYDSTAHSPYTLLIEDDQFGGTQSVGRVYFKLRIIILTDPELLTALSYKSNRTYTLPPLNVSLVKEPKPPLSNLTASGMCESGKTFYVTYRMISDQPISNTSYGYGPTMHCGYVQKVNGYTDQDGYSYYLSAKFPALAFPNMRKSTDFVAFTGMGWTANKVQLLVAKVDDEEDFGLGYIPTNGWRAISDLTIGGNGIVSGSSYSATVDPEELVGHQFIVSNEDYLSGTTYDLSEHYPDFFWRTDYKGPNKNLGLTYGNESFFPGVIHTVMAATVFKTTWKVAMSNESFNSSLNSTFNGETNSSTYVTEIGIFDDEKRLVGIAKPTWPIKKNYGRYLTFELEFDF